MNTNTVEHGQMEQGHVVAIISSNAGQSLDIKRRRLNAKKSVAMKILTPKLPMKYICIFT